MIQMKLVRERRMIKLMMMMMKRGQLNLQDLLQRTNMGNTFQLDICQKWILSICARMCNNFQT